jgi:hypothetical protein
MTTTDHSTTNLGAHAWDLAEALVIADAVGDDDRADRLLAELRALPATLTGIAALGDPAGPLLRRALGAVDAAGETRLAGRLAALIPGPAQAAHHLGLTPETDDDAATPASVTADGATRHRVTVWPQFWPALATGAKTFEVRRDDGRGYAVGDLLDLAEYDPEALEHERWTGRTMVRRITYAVTAADLDALGLHYLAPGTVVLGLGEVVT